MLNYYLNIVLNKMIYKIIFFQIIELIALILNK